jgi:hypothetical protein
MVDSDDVLLLRPVAGQDLLPAAHGRPAPGASRTATSLHVVDVSSLLAPLERQALELVGSRLA